ncbi:MAG: 5-methyltetrahydropteroyltriglutamate--homocysteine S-methyltransferase, partial [Ginsengibacter sp.]
MLTHNLGYPRIGNHRELKKANEQYWAGKISANELEHIAKSIRKQNWQIQKDAGINIIPCNDFSYYDHVLDTSLMVGAVPERYHSLMEKKQLPDIDLLFAMARGYQKNDFDITAMEMTKWFDTNYHFIVPEFTANQSFSFFCKKILHEFQEAKREGFNAKPVLLGPVSFLLLGKEKEEGFHRLELIKNLLPVYLEVLKNLDEADAHYIQFDEPCLSLNLTDEERKVFVKVYNDIKKAFPHLHIILATYFECYGDNLQTVLKLPIQTLHLDVVHCPLQLDDILETDIRKSKLNLSLGVVEGRNIWKNDFTDSLRLINKVVKAIGRDRIMIAPSCSLLHVPCDLDLETDEKNLPSEVKNWLAFAKQKVDEVVTLATLSEEDPSAENMKKLEENKKAIQGKRESSLIHKQKIKDRIKNVSEKDIKRNSGFNNRKS